MMKVFVIAETEKGARELAAGARQLGDSVALVAVGTDAVAGVADVAYHVAVPEGAMAEDAAGAIVGLVEAEGAAVVLAEPTRRMKVVAGRIAAAFKTSAVTDVNAFDGDVAANLYFGGLATTRQTVKGDVKVYITGAAPFGEAEATGTDAVEELAFEPSAKAKVVAVDALPPKSVDLTACKNIVAAGRGFNEEGKLDWAREIAKLIGGEMGCTRPLTEAENWLPREVYIGVSGLMLSPDVYVGLGVSGQMQHMVGVNTAKTVFAVNKDENAPIFAQADYGLVADIDAALPQIIEKLK